MKIKVWTKQPNHFIQQAGQLLLQRRHSKIQADQLQNGQINGDLITFDNISNAQFCALEDTAVRMDLQYDGSQEEQQREPAAQSKQFEGIAIRVLPCCGNTLLQITAMMQVRFIQFIHLDHTSKEPADCLHTKPPDEYIQAVLKEGDRGVITIGIEELLAGSDERTISFLVRNLNLAEIDNHHDIPLKVEIV